MNSTRRYLNACCDEGVLEMEKCYYCNRHAGDKVLQVLTSPNRDVVSLPYCSEPCKEELILYGNYEEKHGRKLTLVYRSILGAMTVLFVIRAIIQHENLYLSYIMSATLTVAGVSFLLFPFAKLSECSFWGVRRSKIIVRVGAIIILIWAAWIIFSAPYIFGTHLN